MCHLGTGFSGGMGSVVLMIELYGLNNIFQTKLFWVYENIFTEIDSWERES